MPPRGVVADRLIAIRANDDQAEDNHRDGCQRYDRSDPSTSTAPAQFRQWSWRCVSAPRYVERSIRDLERSQRRRLIVQGLAQQGADIVVEHTHVNSP
jgi:hypothetical protein